MAMEVRLCLDSLIYANSFNFCDNVLVQIHQRL